MVRNLTIEINCPKCRCPIKASIKRLGIKDFLIYICPECQGNVVYYKDKVDLISDRLLHKLFQKRKLKTCGVIDGLQQSNPASDKKVITLGDVTNLKILLDVSKDVDDFLSKI